MFICFFSVCAIWQKLRFVKLWGCRNCSFLCLWALIRWSIQSFLFTMHACYGYDIGVFCFWRRRTVFFFFMIVVGLMLYILSHWIRENIWNHFFYMQFKILLHIRFTHVLWLIYFCFFSPGGSHMYLLYFLIMKLKRSIINMYPKWRQSGWPGYFVEYKCPQRCTPRPYLMKLLYIYSCYPRTVSSAKLWALVPWL